MDIKLNEDDIMKVQAPSMSIKHEVIEIFDKETNEKKFLLKQNHKWKKITEKEYKKMIEVK